MKTGISLRRAWGSLAIALAIGFALILAGCTQSSTVLHDSARSNSAADVKMALQTTPVDARDREGATALIVAAKNNALQYRILDNTVGDRYTGRSLPNQRRRLIGKIAEIEDAPQIIAHRRFVETISYFCLNCGKDFV